MFRKTVSILLAVLLAVLCLPTLAEAQSKAKATVPSVELTRVPNIGETKNVQGKVYLKGLDPEEYVIVAIVGGQWPKPYYDSYQNKLTASENADYATFSFSVTTGGQDTSYKTFTLYLCEAARLKGVNGTKVTDSFMQNRYVLEMKVDKAAFNAQAELPQPTPVPTAEPYAFKVYEDAMVHYGDVAYMGSQNNGDDGSMTVDPACSENPHSGSKCIQIIYAPPAKNHWAGMMWLSGASNFPPNLPVDGVDATQAGQLTFYARGLGSTKFFIENEQKQQMTLKVDLTEDWKQYTLAVPSDWVQVCVGFGFASSGAAGKGLIYLDDITYTN
ncbi:MAG: hypothetical protein GX418_00330 [Clostridiales bacterium]|nr:hypothetical protein [Clostridiales bacterium]